MKISLVIPVYNVEKYLRKCLDSVCVQSGTVAEILLVNDGSTDNSLQICKEYAEKDGRIHIIDQENGGLSNAVRVGVRAASCDYIGFVDSDDYIEKDMYEKLAGAIDCNSARAGYNEAKRVSEALCQSFRAQYGMDAVIARLARCFGADRKKDSKALAQFFERAVGGEDIVLKSAGRQRFSYCYVADAVSGLIKILLDGENGEAYNISEDDEGKSLGDYAGEIAALAGQKVIMEAQEVKGASKADYAVLDCAKLKSLGWQPFFTVAEGLKRTYRIYKGE